MPRKSEDCINSPARSSRACTMRRGESLSLAARLEHTRARTVLKFIESNSRKGLGRYLPRGDTLRAI
jgi:hypothetical protein